MGGLGLKSLPSESDVDREEVTDARAPMKLGFGGRGGFGLPFVVSEFTLRRTAGCSCGEGGSVCCRRGGGGGGSFLSRGVEVGIWGAVILIQSGSSDMSKGFLGRLGLSTHPSPGGRGMSTLDDALLSSHHFLLSDDGGGTTIS